MKLSTRTRYGIRAVLELAENYGKGPIQLKVIARDQGISVKYLEQLMATLKSSGIVSSVRGSKGGYVLNDCDGTPDAIIIATGSEIALATGAAEQLAGKKIRIVSMPSTTVFEAQDEAYKESVLPSSVTARVAVEAAVTQGWYKYVGLQGKVVGIDRFGESAPAGQLFEHFGFTVDNVVKAVNSVL